MKEHFFLCINKANQSGIGGGEFLEFKTHQEADAYFKHWLSFHCGITTYTGEEEKKKLIEENHGELPELSLACPEVTCPADLRNYNGHYYFDFGGSVDISIIVVEDELSARRMKNSAIKEYQLDKAFSEEADEMMDMLNIIEESFRSDVNYEEAKEMVHRLIKLDGLTFF